MKKIFTILTTLSVLTTGQLIKADNIATIEGNYHYPGTTVFLDSDPVITAIMSQAGGIFNGVYINGAYSVLAQDSSGSIDIIGGEFYFNGNHYEPTVGEKISLSGTYGFAHQIPTIMIQGEVRLISTGNPVPTPATYTIPQLSVATLPQNIEGYLVQLDNVTIQGASGLFSSSGNTRYTIGDGSGNTMTMYYWPTDYSVDAALAGTLVPTGPVDILGLVRSFTTGNNEIIPYAITAVPEPSTLAFSMVGGVVGMIVLGRRKLSASVGGTV